MENILEIKNLTKRYRDFTLDGLSLTMPAGCIMGLVGENGAGKSTTIKLILDLLRKDAGEITMFGKTVDRSFRQSREHIGVVMDECNFPEQMTAAHVAGMLKKCYSTWDGQRFARYQEMFSLPQGKKIKDYSRGMKMKLQLAAALSHDSRLLLLDEATSGLDPIVRDKVLDIFLEFIQDESHGIFVSSHIVSDLEKVCDYVAFLHKGRLVFSEEKSGLLEKYAIVKCSEEKLADLDADAVVGVRRSSFGVEALALRDRIPGGMVCDRAGIEDIMLFYVKEEAR